MNLPPSAGSLNNLQKSIDKLRLFSGKNDNRFVCPSNLMLDWAAEAQKRPLARTAANGSA